jgi:hypothetical protein
VSGELCIAINGREWSHHPVEKESELGAGVGLSFDIYQELRRIPLQVDIIDPVREVGD